MTIDFYNYQVKKKPSPEKTKFHATGACKNLIAVVRQARSVGLPLCCLQHRKNHSSINYLKTFCMDYSCKRIREIYIDTHQNFSPTF